MIIAFNVVIMFFYRDVCKFRKKLEGDSQFDDEDAEENRLYAQTWFSGKKQALLPAFDIISKRGYSG